LQEFKSCRMGPPLSVRGWYLSLPRNERIRLGSISVPGNRYLPLATPATPVTPVTPDLHLAAFQPEVGLCVFETNSSDQVAEQFFVSRDFATVYFLAKQIA